MNAARRGLNWILKHRLISVLLVIVAIGGFGTFRHIRQLTTGTVSPPLERGQVIQSVYGIGTVMARHIHQVKLGTVGTLMRLYVREGDSVKKGDKLAMIDGVSYRAPFAGVVNSVPFNEGENVPAGTVILSIVDPIDRYMTVSLEQQGALRVKAGQEVKMSFDSIRETSYDGAVAAVYSNETQFLARIDIDRLPLQILPGMTADVAITVGQHQDVLLAPVASIEDGKRVWVKRGLQLPKPVDVKLGFIDRAMAEITSDDVRPGDRLLIRKSLTP